MVKTAVVMAAGLGTRFGQYTELIPKGFIEIGGKSMIVRAIDTLLSCGIERVVIGTGYRREAYEALHEIYPCVECHYSSRYAETNSMYTLYNTREAIGNDDFLLLESDLIFEERAILSLLDCPEPDVMLIAPLTKFQDEYFVEHDAGYRLTNCSVRKEDLDVKGELVGIHKISNRFYQKMCDDYATIMGEQPKLGYEYELLRMSRTILPIHVLKVDGLKWYEIDDEADLEYAERHMIRYC